MKPLLGVWVCVSSLDLHSFFSCVHFILKFALHGCKIETTKSGFLEKKIAKKKKISGKIFSLRFGQKH